MVGAGLDSGADGSARRPGALLWWPLACSAAEERSPSRRTPWRRPQRLARGPDVRLVEEDARLLAIDWPRGGRRLLYLPFGRASVRAQIWLGHRRSSRSRRLSRQGGHFATVVAAVASSRWGVPECVPGSRACWTRLLPPLTSSGPRAAGAPPARSHGSHRKGSFSQMIDWAAAARCASISAPRNSCRSPDQGRGSGW
jgi:hypothetical protein